MPDKVLCGIGNPLLDIQATVAKGYLEKYSLESNNQILADDSHVPIYNELVSWFPVDYFPGGATLNSIRVAQWLLGDKGKTVYSGAIGDDDFAKTLVNKVKEAGIEPLFYVQSELPTGTCAALISGQGHRSLVANLAAANTYKSSFLSGETWSKIASADIYYSAGFFLTPPEGPECMEKIAKHAADNNKIYTMNLSAPFLCQFFKDPMHKILPYCDFIFGNETEAAAFAENNNISDTSIPEIAKHIAKLPKVNQKRKRFVVITQGAESTCVADSDGNVQEFAVTKVDSLVDTNGAGDAFVAGFLSMLLQDKPINECVEAGHWSAGVIIQRQGCTFPEKCEFKQ